MSGTLQGLAESVRHVAEPHDRGGLARHDLQGGQEVGCNRLPSYKTLLKTHLSPNIQRFKADFGKKINPSVLDKVALLR